VRLEAFTHRIGRRGWRAWAIAAAAALITIAAQPVWAQDDRDGKKLDRHLRQAIEQGADEDAPAHVIVTVRPGARRGLVQKLRAHGATVSADFTVIDASAAQLTPRQMRRLARDPDVVSISVDADVRADGVAATISGSPLNGGYSLRSALGLRTVTATTTTRSFQQGNAAYTGTVDTEVRQSSPTTTRNSSAQMEADNDLSSGYQWTLIRFDNIFGSGASQIPPGSTITSATLTLQHLADGSSSASASLRRMLADWTGSSTWNSLAVSGPGLQFDNIEALATGDATVSNLAIAGAKVFSGAALTATVQAWSNGQPNYGWVVWQNHDNGWIMRSSEDGTVANRPLLTVTYRAPVETTTLTGNGVTIAVVDSGLFEDGGGTTRIKTTRDFTTGLTNPPHRTSPLDGYGHGTHVAGLIGGNKAEVLGVAPGSQLVSLRALNDFGVGSTSHVINAIQWAIANRQLYGIDVLNLSLGHPIYEPAASDPLVQAVEAAVRAGITVVVAAGNMGMNPATGQVGYAGISSPGNAPSAITVGSSRTMGTTTRQDDLVSDFSSRGPTWFDAFAKPDVVAPGQFLASAATTAQVLYGMLPMLRAPSYGGRAYLHLSGTSMAAGVVSGTVALMIEQSKASFGVRPSSHAIKAMLQRSAIPLSNTAGERYDVLTQGAGSLNALGAAQLAAALDPRVAVGSNWVSAAIPLTTAIDGQTIGWNDNIVWGTNILWGDSLDTRLTAWSDNIVWGTSDNIVWGTSLPSRTLSDNIVWGTSYAWTDNIVWGTSDNIVWGTSNDNVVWGTRDYLCSGSNDNIVWGTSFLATLTF
jgi:subtilisin family serine protease